MCINSKHLLLTQETTLPHWSPWHKLLFRFWGLYFIIYFYLSHFSGLWLPIARKLAPMMGINNYLTVNHNGSGDGLFNYVQVACMLLVAFTVSVVWSAIDRRRKSYYTAFYWVWVVVRYTVGYYMLVYGLSKVYVGQFPAPTLHRLVQPYGMSSPMGLAWTFMGASRGFSMFTGLAESLGGFLLLFRPTVKAGALLSFGVLAVIVAMNFGYDIPVKLFSSHLLLGTIFILAPEMSRLLKFMFTGKAIAASAMYMVPFSSTGPKIARTSIKTVAMLVLMMVMLQMYASEKEWYLEKETVPLAGLYTAETVVQGNDTIPARLNDATRWHYFIVQFEGKATIRYMNDSAAYYEMTVDTLKNVVTLKGDDEKEMYLHYKQQDKSLTFERYLNNDTTRYILSRKTADDFLLINRGFHWVNEVPYNR